MNDPATSIRSYLATVGFVMYNSSTPLAAFSMHLGKLPDKPDAAILINSTGGMPPEPRLLLNYPSVQVVVRGAPSGYVAAAAKIQEVVNALVGATPGNLSGDVYRGCIQVGDVSYLGQDENTRDLFSANFRFFVEPAQVAGGHRVPIQ
jgi:hypothetical protein